MAYQNLCDMHMTYQYSCVIGLYTRSSIIRLALIACHQFGIFRFIRWESTTKIWRRAVFSGGRFRLWHRLPRSKYFQNTIPEFKRSGLCKHTKRNKSRNLLVVQGTVKYAAYQNLYISKST